VSEYVEVARAESERGEIVLRERRDPHAGPAAPVVLELRVNGVFVMDTRETTSEKALASTALGQVDSPRNVVVGGLGLGFTMHEVLADQRVERLVVVEIEDALVRWMRDGTVPHGPSYLADQRISVMTADIRVAMAEATPAAYDLVLLDVDNGPGFLVYDANAAVYEHEFLAQTRACLRPGGALVVWSAAESAELQQTMREVFGSVVAIPYDVTLQTREEHYWIYLARTPATGH
jgi:spermidine synthase